MVEGEFLGERIGAADSEVVDNDPAAGITTVPIKADVEPHVSQPIDQSGASEAGGGNA